MHWIAHALWQCHPHSACGGVAASFRSRRCRNCCVHRVRGPNSTPSSPNTRRQTCCHGTLRLSLAAMARANVARRKRRMAAVPLVVCRTEAWARLYPPIHAGYHRKYGDRKCAPGLEFNRFPLLKSEIGEHSSIVQLVKKSPRRRGKCNDTATHLNANALACSTPSHSSSPTTT